MNYYIMVAEGDYPIAVIEKTHKEHLPKKKWMDGNKLDFEIGEPIIYDLEDDEDEYDEVPNIEALGDHLPIPFICTDLHEALLAAGVDNLQVFDAVIRDLKRGIEHKNYKAFNVVGKVAAADMEASARMGVSDNSMISADFDALVIDKNKAGKGDLLLFRLAENYSAIVVHDKIKKAVEESGIPGIFFYASGEWSGQLTSFFNNLSK